MIGEELSWGELGVLKHTTRLINIAKKIELVYNCRYIAYHSKFYIASLEIICVIL
jgi:hypothetical protein